MKFTGSYTMLGDLYGFSRCAGADVDALAPLEGFKPANAVMNKQYTIGNPN